MDSETLIGLIMMFTIGSAIGNYATSVVYRLPLGQTPFEKHPYCGNCNTLLAPRDLVPIWSYVFLRGRCRYCRVTIPPIHTAVELACTLIFIVNYLVLGFGELFLLYTALGVFWVILAALYYQHRTLYPLILTFCFFLAAMARLLTDGSIYPMIESGFMLFFMVLAGWRIAKGRTSINAENTGYRIPDWAVLAALAGIALPLKEAAMAMMIASVLSVIIRNQNAAASLCGACVWLALIYSHSSSSL